MVSNQRDVQAATLEEHVTYMSYTIWTNFQVNKQSQ